jgi:hypothetical protein
MYLLPYSCGYVTLPLLLLSWLIMDKTQLYISGLSLSLWASVFELYPNWAGFWICLWVVKD